jgi:hypothetical protein
MRRANRRWHDEDALLFGDDLFDGEPEETAEAVEGSGQAAAQLADGSGFLIVDGPGAGSIRDHGTGLDIREGPPLPGRDDALDSALPVFIVHRPHVFHKAVPRLLAQLHSAAGGNLALGVSSRLPGATAKSHADFSSSCSAAAIRIIDPLGYFADQQDVRVNKPTEQAVKWAPYLRSPAMPAADLLDMQRERGANLLLTSGRALDSSDARRSLAKVTDEGDDALAELKPGERLAPPPAAAGCAADRAHREAAVCHLARPRAVALISQGLDPTHRREPARRVPQTRSDSGR